MFDLPEGVPEAAVGGVAATEVSYDGKLDTLTVKFPNFKASLRLSSKGKPGLMPSPATVAGNGKTRTIRVGWVNVK